MSRHFATWVEAAIALLLLVAVVALGVIALLLGLLFDAEHRRSAENMRAICLAEKLLDERDRSAPCPAVPER